MKKFLSFSLIAFIIVANLFAPISVVFNKKNNNFNVKKNVVNAASSGINLKVDALANDNSIRAHVTISWKKNKIFTKESVRVIILEKDKTTVVENKEVVDYLKGDGTQEADIIFTKNIKPNTTYYIKSYAMQFKANFPLSSFAPAVVPVIKTDAGITGESNPKLLPIKTNPKGKTTFKSQGSQTSIKPADIMPSCGVGVISGSIMGCVAQIIYGLIFVPSSYLFALSGTFFDNTFNYSVQSSSYKSQFVVQGWNIVRDFVNMFFIFVLLYIAFSTILNINGAKTKEMVVNVIIIGLLINFSLFATRVIIDTSNILARVFYNTNTIKITQVDGPDASGVVTALNPNGVIPLSAALINKVNPQAIIINAGKVGNIVDKGGQTNNNDGKNGVSTGTFILITLLASGINIIGFVVFLTVGLLFIIRVVGLWLAMILAPFAFFSYTVPAMQSIDMVGWKKWWPETIKLAFMAPIFVFFIYLILQFLNSGLGVMDTASTGTLSFILRTIIPFAFIMVLLIKAKDIAVKLSGEMGSAVSKAGSAIGGMALGAVTGGASMAMRGTVGKLGSSIANSERLKRAETRGVFGSKILRNIGNTAQNKSFDIRNTKLGSAASKGLGVDFGKANKGGFKQIKEENIEKRVKRAKELEVGEDSNATQLVRQRERELEAIKTDPEIQNTLIELNNGMGGLERALSTRQRELADAERNLRDVVNVSGADSNEADTARMEQARAVTRRDIARRELEVRQQDIRNTERPIHDAENNLSLAKNNEIGINRERREAYANTIQGGWSNAINNIISFNEHSNLGEREAANKILSGIKEGERLKNTE